MMFTEIKPLYKVLLGCLAAVILIAGINKMIPREAAQNPDPNHTHADVAVFVGGKKLNFSQEEYMSGHDAAAGQHNPYLHFHDGNGDVIHRHKPGLSLEEFFLSIGFDPDEKCRNQKGTPNPKCLFPAGSKKPRMFVNEAEQPYDMGYTFKDLDRILLTDSEDVGAINSQLDQVKDDACKYSKTCPERGEPPSEGCVADPEVPCTE